MKPVRLIIADDHTIFREGLVAMLSNEPLIATILEAQNGYEVMDLVRAHSVDVVLMDMEMPLKNGLETTRELQKEFPHVGVLALTMHKGPAYVKQMLKAGALGYVLKETSKNDLVKAISLVAAGKSYYSWGVTQSVMESLHQKKDSNAPLSKRELQIIQLISNQLTSREIATKLHLSTATIETHRKNIFLKLGVRNIAGLVKMAFKKGWID